VQSIEYANFYLPLILATDQQSYCLLDEVLSIIQSEGMELSQGPEAVVHAYDWPGKMPIRYLKTIFSVDEQGNGPGAAKYFDFEPIFASNAWTSFSNVLMSSMPLNLR
jgi:hypothetical protein